MNFGRNYASSPEYPIPGYLDDFGDAEVCDAATPCPEGDFCSNGCCIPEVVIN